MSLIVNNSVSSQEELIQKVELAEGIEVVDTGHHLWPKAISDGVNQFVIEPDGSYLVSGAADFMKVQAALRRVGVEIVSIE